MPKIFDFDSTLSCEHTFHDRCLEKCTADSFEHLYQLGKRDAVRNLKLCLDTIFTHDEKGISCIATHHNNPHFIAGYVSVILKKELSLAHSRFSSTEPLVAINYYEVKDSDNPFLISYLPQRGDQFNKTRAVLKNKNKQISELRAALVELEMITNDAIIDFYDDSIENIIAAKFLPQLNCHWIEGSNMTFRIINSHNVSLSPRFEIATPVAASLNSQEKNQRPELKLTAIVTDEETETTSPSSGDVNKLASSMAQLGFFERKENVTETVECSLKDTAKEPTGQ